MKRIIFCLSLIGVLGSQIFANLACIDAAAHLPFGKIANEAYNQLDRQTAEFIKKINSMLVDRVQKSEQANEEDARNLLALEKDAGVTIKEKLFYQKMLNALQSNHNSVGSISK